MGLTHAISFRTPLLNRTVNLIGRPGEAARRSIFRKRQIFAEGLGKCHIFSNSICCNLIGDPEATTDAETSKTAKALFLGKRKNLQRDLRNRISHSVSFVKSYFHFKRRPGGNDRRRKRDICPFLNPTVDLNGGPGETAAVENANNENTRF